MVAPGAHLLDLAGPAQVFSAAADFAAVYELAYVGDGDMTCSHQGLPLCISSAWPDLSVQDLVIVVGWRTGDGPTPINLSVDILERIKAHHTRGGRVASVCVGAFALAAAGLLDGRRATTHHEVQDELARRFPSVRVVPDVLFVVDDRVYSSAGIASGI